MLIHTTFQRGDAIVVKIEISGRYFMCIFAITSAVSIAVASKILMCIENSFS